MTVKQQPAIIRAIKKTWKEYAIETSIHGVKYAVGRRRIDRWIWTIVPLISTVGASIMVVIMYRGYFAEPTRAIYESQYAPLQDFAFPGITICAPRKFNKKYTSSLMGKLKIPANITTRQVEKLLPFLLGFTMPVTTEGHDLSVLDYVFSTNNLTIPDVMKLLMPSCRRILKKCRWEGDDFPCKALFKRSKTKDGYCCSFNYNTNFTNAHFQGIHTKYFGPGMGLSVVVDTIGLYNKQVFHTMDSFKILVHNSQSFVGRFTTEIVMPLRSEVHVAIYPLQIKIGSQAILLSPENRKCYTAFEFSLEHFALYRKADCLVECEISKSVDECGCQPFMYPRNEADIVCNASSIPCLKSHFSLVQSTAWGKNCTCPTQCNENSTELSTDSTDLSGANFNSDPLYNLLTENQTLVHFYAGKQYGNIVRKAVITYWVDLISSFGGVFNLFLGCSFLSVLEIFYFVLIKFPRNFWNMLEINAKKSIKPDEINS